MPLLATGAVLKLQNATIGGELVIEEGVPFYNVKADKTNHQAWLTVGHIKALAEAQVRPPISPTSVTRCS